MIEQVVKPALQLTPSSDYAVHRIFKKMNRCHAFHHHLYIFLMPDNVNAVFNDYKYDYRMNPLVTPLYSKSVFFDMHNNFQSFCKKIPAHEKIVVTYPTWITPEDIFLSLKPIISHLNRLNRIWPE